MAFWFCAFYRRLSLGHPAGILAIILDMKLHTVRNMSVGIRKDRMPDIEMDLILVMHQDILTGTRMLSRI